MANMTFKANLLPNSNLGYNLGSSTQKWNVYGDLLGTPTAPTAATGTNTTQIATTAFVQATITTALNNILYDGSSTDL